MRLSTTRTPLSDLPHKPAPSAIRFFSPVRGTTRQLLCTLYAPAGILRALGGLLRQIRLGSRADPIYMPMQETHHLPGLHRSTRAGRRRPGPWPTGHAGPVLRRGKPELRYADQHPAPSRPNSDYSRRPTDNILHSFSPLFFSPAARAAKPVADSTNTLFSLWWTVSNIHPGDPPNSLAIWAKG